MTASTLPLTISIDGVDVAEDETPFCGRHHKWPDEIAAYVVVATRFDRGKVRDLEAFAPTDYGLAVACAHVHRHEPGEGADYARIDVVYVDGCRGIL